jgi:translation elongation factor P/translation initiation factor 5A
MFSFPIAVRIKFNKIVPSEVEPSLVEEVTVKADELYYLNKMDLYINFVDDYTTERYFADNAAADEWLAFIKDATARNNLEIVSITVSTI